MFGKIRRMMEKSRNANVSRPLEKNLEKIDLSLDTNIEYIKMILGDAPDMVIRRIQSLPKEAALIFLRNSSNEGKISSLVIKPLVRQREEIEEPLDIWIEKTIEISDYTKVENMDQLFGALMSGEAILLVEGFRFGYAMNAIDLKGRNVEEPSTESVIRGPKVGFNENIATSMGLVRNTCRDPNLHFEHLKVGRRSKTDVMVVYIAGIAKEDLIEEVKNRIRRVDTDKIMDSGDLEEYLEDHPNSPFPQLKATERVDRLSAGLMEGKVGILIGNSPFALMAPASFHVLISSPEDYYEKWVISSLIRASRYLAFLLSMALPGLYVALISFNVGLLPLNFLVTIASARQGVPFPAFIEVLLMEVGLEFLQEASVRLPKSVGQTVGVVGGLILGEAAVKAGLVSSAMVIVIALTAISSFIIPSYQLMLTSRVLRLPLMIVASIFGLYGLILGLMIIFIHVVSLTSFQESYLAPWGEGKLSSIKDTLFRFPMRSFKKRPEYLGPEDTIRQKTQKDDWW